MAKILSIIIPSVLLLAVAVCYIPGHTFFLTLFFTTFFLLTRVRGKMRKILLTALLLRSALMFFQFFVGGLPDSDGDAVAFDRLALQLADGWSSGLSNEVIYLSGAYPYYYSMAILYYIFGHVQLIPMFINVLFGIGAVWMTYKVTKEITDSEKIAVTSAWIAALYPTLNLYSAIPLRDMPIVFFTLYSFYRFLKWVKGGGLGNMVAAVLFLLLASSLHSAMFPIGVVYALFYCFYQPGRKRVSLLGPRILVGIVGFGLIVLKFGSVIFSKLDPSKLDATVISAQVANYAVDRTAYLVGMSPSSIFDILLYSPIRIIYLYLAPFPWMMSSAKDIVALLDTWMYAILILFLVKGLKYIKGMSKPIFYAVLLVFLMESFIFAWGVSTYGAGIRHRIKILWIIAPMAAIGWNVMKSKKEEIRQRGKDKLTLQKNIIQGAKVSSEVSRS